MDTLEDYIYDHLKSHLVTSKMTAERVDGELIVTHNYGFDLDLYNLTHPLTQADEEVFYHVPDDKDGVPIRLGETRYGKDGTRWYIKGYQRGKYPIIGTAYDKQRDLKPEWLSKKKPIRDPAEIADEMHKYAADNMWSSNINLETLNKISGWAVELKRGAKEKK